MLYTFCHHSIQKNLNLSIFPQYRMRIIYCKLRSVRFVSIPDQEQEPEYQKNKDYEYSEAPHAAHRSRVTATPVLLNLFPTLVAEINAAPAFKIKPPREYNYSLQYSVCFVIK